jgi:hypothetical protein
MKRELGVKKLVEVFQSEKVLDLDAVKRIIDSESRMTVFRKLKTLGYHSSYSHHGRYYTLCSIAKFDKNGLWSFSGVHFSRYGSLMRTIPVFVKRSEAGCFASELELVVHVFVQNALSKLYTSGRLLREQIGGEYLYLSPLTADEQLCQRKKMLTLAVWRSFSKDDSCRESLGEHLKTFLSVLNEKQRRLYLGFESLKIGYGGDVQMALSVGVNAKTVSRGRKELLSKAIDVGRVRRKGAGRPPLKKTKL